MPAVNFDLFHFLEKYWRDVTLFDYAENQERLGINFVTFGFDSVHFLQNVRSSLALTAALLLIFTFSSWALAKQKVRKYMWDATLVLGKTVIYYVFIISAVI